MHPLLRTALSDSITHQTWLGGRMPGGPNAVRQGPLLHLLLADLPAFVEPDLPSSPATEIWFGYQLLPGTLPNPSDATGLLLNVMSIDEAHEEEFNDWYNNEHIERISKVPGVLAARRFRVIEGNPDYAAVYHLASPTVPQSAAWAQAASTPWTVRMQRFRTNNRRYLFTLDT